MVFFLIASTGCLPIRTSRSVKVAEVETVDRTDVNVKKKLRRWKKKLYSKDPTIQTAAAVSILGLEYPPAYELLKDILQNPKKTSITVAVLKAFGFAGDDEVLMLIIPFLDNESDEVKSAATETLGKIKTDRAHKMMISHLLDAQQSIESRTLIVQAIGDVRNRESVEPLIDVLKLEEESLQVASHSALVKITRQSIGLDVDKWEEWWDLNKVKSREVWLEEIVEELEETVKHVKAENAVLNKEIAKKSIEFLTLSSNNSDISIFLDAAKSKYPEVRAFAVNELAKRKPPESVDIFSELLLDENLTVKIVAAQALGEIADKRTLASLLEVINVDNPDFQVEVVKALGRIGMVNAVDSLILLLESKSIKLLKATTEALGQIGDVKALNHIIPLIQAEEPGVRESATIALGKIRDERSVVPLIEALSDKGERVRWYAADSLGKLKAKKAVDPLIKLLEDSSARVRESATTSLGQIGDEKAVSYLTKMLDDQDERVVEQASDALIAIAGGELKALDNLSDIFFLKNDYARATKVLEKQLARFSENEEALWKSRIKLAKSAALTGNHEKAIDLYSKLVEHFPENIEFKNELLHSMLEMKQYEMALERLSEWLNGPYNHKELFWNIRLEIIETIFNDGKYEKVNAFVDKFKLENPDLGGVQLRTEFLNLKEKSLINIKEVNSDNREVELLKR